MCGIEIAHHNDMHEGHAAVSVHDYHCRETTTPNEEQT